jgi:hypothetical protein
MTKRDIRRLQGLRSMSGSVSMLVAQADRLVDRARMRLEQYDILLASTEYNSAEWNWCSERIRLHFSNLLAV